MLKDLGCSYVIVGHSERRADHFETDELVCKKPLPLMLPVSRPLFASVKQRRSAMQAKPLRFAAARF